jgi:hypothetical protein
MSITCPACGEANHDAALICELCRTLFKPAASARPPAPVKVASVPSPAAVPVPRLARPPTQVQVPRTQEPPALEGIPHSGQPAVLYIPAAPPRRGHGVALLAGIVGAGVALLVVAAIKCTADPKPAMMEAKPSIERIYVPVPVANSPTTPMEVVNYPFPKQADPAPVARTPEPSHISEPTQPSNQITVPYRGQNAHTQRILVPITVNGSSTVMMALDTGAPGMLISKKLADHLGVLRSDEGTLLTSASGIGGSAPAVLVVLDSLVLGNAREEFVPATVTTSLADNFEGLIGMDFITTFKLRIDAARQVLVLTKPESNTKTPAGHDEQWWRRLFRQFKDQHNRWEKFRDQIDQRVAASQISEGVGIDNLKRLRVIADNQAQEAAKLENRLERHASNHSVPREWR